MSLFRRLHLAFLRRQDLLTKQGVPLLHDATPLFEARRRWTNRWTFTLVFTQLAVTVTGAELIFNHWTERVEPAAGGDADAGSPDASAAEYRLRPVWQRAALASAQYAVGAFIAYLLVSMRSRLVRRLYVVPRAAVDASAPFAPKLQPGDRALVMQNMWHWHGQGEVYPFSRARLEAGSQDSELVLRIGDKPGGYLMALPRAKVNGEEGSSIWDVKKKLYTSWYGEKRGMQELAKLGWEKHGDQ